MALRLVRAMAFAVTAADVPVGVGLGLDEGGGWSVRCETAANEQREIAEKHISMCATFGGHRVRVLFGTVSGDNGVSGSGSWEPSSSTSSES